MTITTACRLPQGNNTGANDTGMPYLQQEYELRMTYNTDHTIENKIQLQRRGVVSSYGGPLNDESVVLKNSYTLDYEGYATAAYVAGPNSYGYQQPHAVRKITEYPTWVSNPEPDDPRVRHKEIEYDANGNQTEIREKVGEVYTSLRKNLWDEENRLRGVDLNPDDEDDHPIAVYTYDAGGARIVRYNLDRIDVSSNAKEIGQEKKDNVMIYPSGLIMGKATEFSPIENRLAYTKHYYIGSERISAKTGTVEDMGLFPASLVSGQIPALTDHEFVRGPSDQSRLDAEAVVRDVHFAFGQSEPQFSGFREDFKIRYDHTLELNTFYFHKDHLGSSSYITNDVGNVTQHMEYLPFGETLVDEHTNSFNSPFKYNGKEFDEETGNYYYGARYYDPKWSIFISVDPLAEQTMSSYGYCYNNPIRFIDPTGMEALEFEDPPVKDSEMWKLHQPKDGHNWLDSDGSWTYNEATETWIGFDESVGNDISAVNSLQEVNVGIDVSLTLGGLSVSAGTEVAAGNASNGFNVASRFLGKFTFDLKKFLSFDAWKNSKVGLKPRVGAKVSNAPTLKSGFKTETSMYAKAEATLFGNGGEFKISQPVSGENVTSYSLGVKVGASPASSLNTTVGTETKSQGTALATDKNDGGY